MDRQAAIVLGKALFWDMNAGSDETQACASCHFNAGADPRIKNQLNPDQRNVSPGPAGSVFDGTASGRRRRAELHAPGGRLSVPPARPIRPTATRPSCSRATTSSARRVCSRRRSTTRRRAPRARRRPTDCFHVGNPPLEVNTRQVTPRNAPTVINAAYNFRNFWDGRASNEFNGRNPFGRRDPDARIWVTDPAGAVSAIRIALKNASAASQAVGPALSDVEMSATGRNFADLGRKLIGMRALSKQLVDPADSVLGSHVYTNASGVQGNGLKETYKQLIQKAFSPKYWNAKQAAFYTTAGTSNSQMEENFSLFWGLSIMALRIDARLRRHPVRSLHGR